MADNEGGESFEEFEEFKEQDLKPEDSRRGHKVRKRRRTGNRER
jgi:hypothetical protein